MNVKVTGRFNRASATGTLVATLLPRIVGVYYFRHERCKPAYSVVSTVWLKDLITRRLPAQSLRKQPYRIAKVEWVHAATLRVVKVNTP